MYIYDLFFVEITSHIVANYANEVIKIDNLINNLELIFIWSEYNNLKVNTSKYHFFLSSYRHTSININGSVIKSSN